MSNGGVRSIGPTLSVCPTCKAAVVVPLAKRGEHTHDELAACWADARLITAAPDLLAALKTLMHTTDEDVNYLAVCEQARAAIAKAEGRS